MKPLLSIIIPHFNSPFLLEKLLQTIPNKPEIQVVVVDDRSTQFIAEYNRCKEQFLGRNIEFYRNRRMGKGAGAARNEGLVYTKGKWIMFADADDYFLNDFYDTIKKYFATNYDIVYFVPISYELKSGKIANRHLYYKKLIERYLEHQNQENFVKLKYGWESPCSRLIRREIIDAYDIKFEEIPVSNDVMFSVKVAYCATRCDVSGECIYAITKSSNTLTSIATKESHMQRLVTTQRKMEYLNTYLSQIELKYLDYNIIGYLYSMKKVQLPKREYIRAFIKLKKIGIPFFERDRRQIRWWVKKIFRGCLF